MKKKVIEIHRRASVHDGEEMACETRGRPRMAGVYVHEDQEGLKRGEMASRRDVRVLGADLDVQQGESRQVQEEIGNGLEGNKRDLQADLNTQEGEGRGQDEGVGQGFEMLEAASRADLSVQEVQGVQMEKEKKEGGGRYLEAFRAGLDAPHEGMGGQTGGKDKKGFAQCEGPFRTDLSVQDRWLGGGREEEGKGAASISTGADLDTQDNMTDQGCMRRHDSMTRSVQECTLEFGIGDIRRGSLSKASQGVRFSSADVQHVQSSLPAWKQ